MTRARARLCVLRARVLRARAFRARACVRWRGEGGLVFRRHFAFGSVVCWVRSGTGLAPLLSRRGQCCSARSGTAMDLGLDYFRVLLALGLFQVEVLHTKTGMAGRGYWGKPPGL